MTEHRNRRHHTAVINTMTVAVLAVIALTQLDPGNFGDGHKARWSVPADRSAKRIRTWAAPHHADRCSLSLKTAGVSPRL